jgi:hypothetical protein
MGGEAHAPRPSTGASAPLVVGLEQDRRVVLARALGIVGAEHERDARLPDEAAERAVEGRAVRALRRAERGWIHRLRPDQKVEGAAGGPVGERKVRSRIFATASKVPTSSRSRR